MIFFAAIIVLLSSEILRAKETVRLVNGVSPYEGTVEVDIEGEWARICDSYFWSDWQMTEADVFCRQLGHPGAMWASSVWKQHGGTWLLNIKCTGDEERIQDCQYDVKSGSQSYCQNAIATCNYAEYLGCFDSDRDNPTLKGKSKDGGNFMTIEACLGFCRAEEPTAYAGVQAGSECYCGDEFELSLATANENCDSECSGNYTQACGGTVFPWSSRYMGIYDASMGDCGGSVLGSLLGTVYSPGFPARYDESSFHNCTWHIKAPNNTVITSDFIMFDIKERYFVEIIDAESCEKQTFTRNDYLLVNETSSNRMDVKFYNDGPPGDGIFALEWEAIYKCYHSGRVEHGAVYPGDKNRYDPGHTLILKCDAGYYPSTNITNVTCLDDGTWDDVLSECIVVSCGDPGQPENAYTEGDDFTYGSNVTYMCHKGHVLNGTETITCQSDGSWDAEVPECNFVSCGDPGQPENAQAEGDDFAYGDNVTFVCHEGYVLNGTEMITCQSDGSWDSEVPVCNVVSCEDPGQPENGDAEGDDFTYGSNVTYLCHEGYVLNGTNVLKCQSDGSWDAEVPVCSVINCGEPDDIDNAEKYGDEFTYNSTVSYKCHEGYAFEGGSDSIICGVDGEWSHTPTCFPTEQANDSNLLSIAAVGGVLAILGLVGIIVSIILLFRRSKNKKSKTNQQSDHRFSSGLTNYGHPLHDYDTVSNSQTLNAKNTRASKRSVVNTNPVFDGELKDFRLDNGVHHPTNDNDAGHLYNYINCSKMDSQSGFVTNDLYRSCSFSTVSADMTTSNEKMEAREPISASCFDGSKEFVRENSAGFKGNDIYESGDTDGDTIHQNEYADVENDTVGFVDNDLYEHGDEAPPESEVKFTDNMLYEASGGDKEENNDDDVYYSTIGNGGNDGELKDNIAYESRA